MTSWSEKYKCWYFLCISSLLLFKDMIFIKDKLFHQHIPLFLPVSLWETIFLWYILSKVIKMVQYLSCRCCKSLIFSLKHTWHFSEFKYIAFKPTHSPAKKILQYSFKSVLNDSANTRCTRRSCHPPGP